MIIKKLMVVLFCFLLLCATACGDSSQTVEKIKQRDPALMTVEKANATDMSLSSYFDFLCGMTHDGNTLIVYGIRREEVIFLYMDKDGNVVNERSISVDTIAVPEPFLYELAAVNDSLYALFGPARRGTDKDVFQLCVIQSDGSVRVLSELESSGFWNQGSYVSADHSIWFWYGHHIVGLNEDGVYRITELADDEEIISLSGRDGDVSVFLLDGRSCKQCAYNKTDGTLEEISTVRMDSQPVAGKCESVDQNIFFNSETNLLEYDPDTETINTRFSWAQINLTGDSVGAVVETEPNHFVCAIPDNNELQFIETEEKEIKRTKISIAALENSFAQDLEYCISVFNSKNESYYAEVRYYKDNAGLSTDVATGAAPDLLEMSQVEIPLKKEYFMDMIPYLRESGIEAEALTGNLWTAMQKEGQLLMLPDSVRIDTVTARSREVGTEPGWTWEEMYRLAEERGDGVRIFPGWMTADDVMLWMSANSLARFIDYSDMTCHFDDEEFIRYLAFCENATKGPAEEQDSYSENVLLQIDGIGILWRIIIIRQNYRGDDYTFIGFPDDTGENGNVFRCANNCLRFCMPRNAQTPDGAGAFLSFLLSPEWQSRVMEMPVVQEVFDQRLSDISTPDGVEATDSDIAKLKGLVDNTHTFVCEDTRILNIVREEAGAYLKHQKSAEEVAAIIQNRVRIYLQEKGD